MKLLSQISNENFPQQVDAADPSFPRPTAHWWFGCKNSPSQFSGSNSNMELNRENANDFLYEDAG